MQDLTDARLEKLLVPKSHDKKKNKAKNEQQQLFEEASQKQQERNRSHLTSKHNTLWQPCTQEFIKQLPGKPGFNASGTDFESTDNRFQIHKHGNTETIDISSTASGKIMSRNKVHNNNLYSQKSRGSFEEKNEKAELPEIFW